MEESHGARIAGSVAHDGWLLLLHSKRYPPWARLRPHRGIATVCPLDIGGELMVTMAPDFLSSLRLEWPAWRPPGPGVVAVVREAEMTGGWSRALLARGAGLLHVWAAGDSDLVVSGLGATCRRGVLAATLAPADVDPRHLWLALRVSHQVMRQREADAGGLSRAPLTSWSPPNTPPGTVRIPHLVTVWHGDLATDSVVWEVLDLQSARRWLGTADLEFLESNLDALVRLHERVRTRDLPPTTAAARLLMILGPGRDFPTSLVLQRPELFRALLTGNARPDHHY